MKDDALKSDAVAAPRLTAAPFWTVAAAALVLGAATSWTQAPHSFYALLFLTLPLTAVLFDSVDSVRRAAVVGSTFGFGYFVPGLLWIGEAFFVEAERFAWLAPFAVTLLPAYLSLFWAAAFALAKRLGGSVWALTLCWALAEYLRGQLFTGFPWGMFAFAWVDAPVGQTAAWFGPFALNLLTIFVALALGRGLLTRGLLAAPDEPGSRYRRGAGWTLAALGLLAVGWIGGDARAPQAHPETEYSVRLVQPNVPQTEKWVPEHLQRNFDRLMRLSQEPNGDDLPDLIVWPETAVTPDVVSEARNRAIVMERLGGSWLVVGTQRFDAGGGGVYNSLFALDPEGAIAATYDKHHLVPFGEFLPFQDALEAIGIFQLAGGRGGFSSGPGPTMIETEGAPPFGALICYEAIFPDEMPVGDQRPEVLIQITNDAWFGESSGPYQHLAQAQMRAIEQGLPFIRAANTGVSAAIDPYGRIYADLPLNTQGKLDIRLAAPLGPTLYARYGEAAFFALCALLAMITLAERWRATRRRAA